MLLWYAQSTLYTPEYIWPSVFYQNFLTMLQKTILRDKAVVDVFKAMLGAVNPIQGIVGMTSFMRLIICQDVFNT